MLLILRKIPLSLANLKDIHFRKMNTFDNDIMFESPSTF